MSYLEYVQQHTVVLLGLAGSLLLLPAKTVNAQILEYCQSAVEICATTCLIDDDHRKP